MSKLTFLSVVLMAAIIAGPAMAHERHVIARHATVEQYAAEDAYASAARRKPSCVPAPRVGAFASDPWTNETPCEPVWGY